MGNAVFRGSDSQGRRHALKSAMAISHPWTKGGIGSRGGRRGKYFLGNYVKLGHFFGQESCKFGHFVNFSDIFPGKNVLPPKVD